jgi:hypothetical protein
MITASLHRTFPLDKRGQDISTLPVDLMALKCWKHNFQQDLKALSQVDLHNSPFREESSAGIGYGLSE